MGEGRLKAEGPGYLQVSGQQFQTMSMCSKLADHLNQDGDVRKHECS